MSEERLALAATLREAGDELGARFLEDSPDQPMVDWARARLEEGYSPEGIALLVNHVATALIIATMQTGEDDGE